MPHTIVDLTESSPIAPVKPASMPLDTVLIDAINDAQPSRLAIALQLICRNSVDASRIAQEILLVPEEKAVRKIVDRKNRTESENESEDESEDGSEEDDSATDNSEDGSEDEESDHSEAQGQANHHPPNALKRLRSRYTTCENCSEEFDVTMNGKYDCVWHPDFREPDYDSDVWADHDEDCHGRIDEMEDECPEGFMWSCCERRGDAEGCRIGTHVEKEASSKRARF